MLETVVIVKRYNGWVAHFRFTDIRMNQDVAANTRSVLDGKVDFLLRKSLRYW
jgi:hypothetical protein